MLRVALFIIFMFVVARAFWRLLEGIVDGISRASHPGGDVPQRGVPMVRDPVCGTFLVPANAVSLVEGRSRVYFCSDACRDKYRARPSTGSGRREHVEGRTA